MRIVQDYDIHHFSDIDRVKVEAFLTRLRNQGLGARTYNAYLKTGKAFGGRYQALTANTADVLKNDLAEAGILYEDELGRVFDFRSLRGPCATLLARRGVHPKTAHTILRHRDINLTMNTYTHTLRGQESAAKGYVTKREATKTIVVAIRKVLEHRCYLSEEMGDELLSSLFNNNGPDTGHSPTDQLTDREMEVFCLLGHGKGTREIAEQLYLSVKTIQTYRSRIKEKLHLETNSQLLQHAFKWTSAQEPGGSL